MGPWSKKVLSFGMKPGNAIMSSLEFEILCYKLKIFSSNHNQPFNNFFFNLQVERNESVTSKKVLSFGMKHRNATASTLEFEILRCTLKIFSSNPIKPFNDFFPSLFQSTGRTECVCDEQEGFVFWNETQK